MKPSLHPLQAPRFDLDTRDQHLVHGLRAALAVAVAVAFIGALFLVVAGQSINDNDPPSSLSTVEDPAAPPVPFGA